MLVIIFNIDLHFQTINRVEKFIPSDVFSMMDVINFELEPRKCAYAWAIIEASVVHNIAGHACGLFTGLSEKWD